MIPASLQPEATRLTDEQLVEAARKWAKRIDSLTIAQQIEVPEYVIYNNLWRIKALARP